MAQKRWIFDIEREDKQAELEHLLDMENKKLSAQMELEGRKLQIEEKKLKFQLAQAALSSGRSMEDIQAMFKFMSFITLAKHHKQCSFLELFFSNVTVP